MGLGERLYSHWEVGTAIQSVERRFNSSGYVVTSASCLPIPDRSDPVNPIDHSVMAKIIFTIPHDHKIQKVGTSDDWEYDKLPYVITRALEGSPYPNNMFSAENGGKHFNVLDARLVDTLPEGSRVVSAVVQLFMNPDRGPTRPLPKRDPKWV